MSQRCLGLDFGASTSQIFYTTSVGEGQAYAEPRPVIFKGKSRISSLALVNQAGEILAVGEDTYQGDKFSAEGLTIQQDIKAHYLQGDDAAEKSLTSLAKVFARDLQETFSVDALSSTIFLSAIGWPVSWARDVSIGNRLSRVLNDAGFPTPKAMGEPVAALHYYCFRDYVKFHRGQSSKVLVIDLAGSNSRVSLMERSESGTIKLLKSQVIEWGGDEIDWRLLSNWFIPQYWADQNTMTDWQRQIARFLIRDFKEDYSEHAKRDSEKVFGNFKSLGIVGRVELTREQFEASEVAGMLIQKLEDALIGVSKDPLFAQAEQVMLIGGSANWYFALPMVEKIWKGCSVVTTDEPETAVAKGLALMVAGYKPNEHEPSSEEPEIVTGQVNMPPPSPSTSQSDVLRQRRRAFAEKQVWTYIWWGSAVAILLGAIPGVSPVVLIGLEIWMTYKIAKIYGVNLHGSMIILTGVGLLAMSIALKTGVEFVLTVFYFLCFLKPLVAGIVIWILGQAAIWFFDRIIYEGGVESIW